MELLLADNSYDLIAFRIVRRLVAPALLAGALSNFAIYRMLGSDESPFQDWKSMAMMAAIALAGMLVGGIPALVLLNRTRVSGAARVAVFIVAGIATGGALALAIANMIVDEGQLGYIKYGLAAGLVGGLVWLIFNLDLTRKPGSGSIS
jgi:peptidoglycan/LPS O-acetylase OafA/YrhL